MDAHSRRASVRCDLCIRRLVRCAVQNPMRCLAGAVGIFLMMTVLGFLALEARSKETSEPPPLLAPAPIPRRPIMENPLSSAPLPSVDASALAEVARRVAALDERLSSFATQAMPATTASPVNAQLALVSQQLQQLTMMATLHFAQEADRNLAAMMPRFASTVPPVTAAPPVTAPPPALAPPVQPTWWQHPAPAPASGDFDSFKKELKDDLKGAKEQWGKDTTRLDSLEEKLKSLYAQQTDRFSELVALVKSDGAQADSSTKAPLHGANGHVCRSPPCSRNQDTCKLNGNCCTDRMFEMLADFTAYLNEKNISYHITAGTLLGAVRDNDIIPYTSDLDIVIPKDSWERVKEINKVEGVAKSYTFLNDPEEHNCARVCAVWEGLPVNRLSYEKHFDWDTEKDGGDIQYYMDVYAEEMDFVVKLEHLNKPYTNVTIRNKTFAAPREPELWVEASYGKSWRTPDNRAHGGLPGQEYPSLDQGEQWSKGALLLRKARTDPALAHRLLERAEVDMATGKVMVNPVGSRPGDDVKVRSLKHEGLVISDGGHARGTVSFLPPATGEAEVTHYAVYWLAERLHGWTPTLERVGEEIIAIPRCGLGGDPFTACGKTGLPVQATLPANTTVPKDATNLGVLCRNEAGDSGTFVDVLLPGSGLEDDASSVSFSRNVALGVLGGLDPGAGAAAHCVVGRRALIRRSDLEALISQMLKKTAEDMKAGFRRLGQWLSPLMTALNKCDEAAAAPLRATLNSSLAHFVAPHSFIYTPMKALEIDGVSVFMGINIAIGALKKEELNKFGTSTGEMLRTVNANAAPPPLQSTSSVPVTSTPLLVATGDAAGATTTLPLITPQPVATGSVLSSVNVVTTVPLSGVDVTTQPSSTGSTSSGNNLLKKRSPSYVQGGLG